MPQTLAKQFSSDHVRFFMRENLMMIEVKNDFANALLTTYGGCVLNYRPNGGEELLWVSPTAVYHGKKPVRGGVPVCWPWFGKGAETGQPAHGFVRNMVWHLDDVRDLESGVTEVVMSCEANENTLAVWPHSFHLQLKVEIGETLALTLTTTNPNDHDLVITEALHTYFKVTQAAGLVIKGLEGATHLDKLAENAPAVTQTGALTLQPPMDSVFLNQTGRVTVEDAVGGRVITIDKAHSMSSVVWNPGAEIVKGFDDIPADDWPHFVCVESGNVLEDAVTVASGEKHALKVVYAIESINAV